MKHHQSLLSVLDKLESGKRPKGGVKGISSGVPSIGGEHLNNNGGFDFSSVKYVPPDFASSMRKGIIQKGDILVVKDGATTGKTSYVGDDFPYDFAVINEHVFLCRANENTNSKYLFYCLWSEQGKRNMLEDFRGAAQGGISTNFAKIVNLPIPSLEDQNKIVVKIEELFSEIDSADKGILDSSTLVKVYQQAAIDEIFSAVWLRANPIQLDNIADIRGGVTKGRKLIDKDIIEIPYLRVANVQDGYLDLGKIKNIIGTKEDLIKYRLEYGDILFTEGGDKDKLGRGTIWRNEIEGCIHQNHIFRARVDLSKTDPEFVSFAAQTTRSRHYFFAKAKQTTNLASINMSQLKQLSIPDIDIEEQRSVVKKINETLSEVAGVRKALKSTTNYSELLKQSVLSKAFKGELI